MCATVHVVDKKLGFCNDWSGRGVCRQICAIEEYVVLVVVMH
jgi:hypothetical protein